jgi:hypothetical protein
MSSKPKKQDYKPSAAEIASAAVAKAEKDYFNAQYDPLLKKMRDESLNERVDKTLRARANADTMQTLAAKADYDLSASGADGGDLAQAYQAQLADADEAAIDIRSKKQLGVLGVARGQAGDAQSGMGAAANMGASRVLTQAKAKQTERAAKTAALGQIATSAIVQGAKNMKTRGKDAQGNEVKGSFLTPVNKDGSKVQGFGNRLSHTDYFGTNPLPQ